MPNIKKNRSNCLVCTKETARPGYKYCSNTCQFKYQHKDYIEKWKSGKISGLAASGLVSVYVKRYLREKYKNKCCLCGWSEVNVKTGLVPLVADHINGDWRNNTESNLRLICQNCDSLSPTYAALNKGKGRNFRRISKRVEEARLFLKNKKPE